LNPFVKGWNMKTLMILLCILISLTGCTVDQKTDFDKYVATLINKTSFGSIPLIDPSSSDLKIGDVGYLGSCDYSPTADRIVSFYPGRIMEVFNRSRMITALVFVDPPMLVAIENVDTNGLVSGIALPSSWCYEVVGTKTLKNTPPGGTTTVFRLRVMDTTKIDEALKPIEKELFAATDEEYTATLELKRRKDRMTSKAYSEALQKIKDKKKAAVQKALEKLSNFPKK